MVIILFCQILYSLIDEHINIPFLNSSYFVSHSNILIFIFNLSLFQALYLYCVFVANTYLYTMFMWNFYHWSENFYLSENFNFFTFNLIIIRVQFKSTIFLLVFYLFYLVFFLLFLIMSFLSECHPWYSILSRYFLLLLLFILSFVFCLSILGMYVIVLY